MYPLGIREALDDLFLTDDGRTEKRLPKIHDLDIADIDEFPDHPFQVRDDEDMEERTKSVKEFGIIHPITVRKKQDGRYELISGHRRVKACQNAGLTQIKADIRDLSDAEATILMVDSNLYRTKILPSEKAKAYKMRMAAMTQQGRRTDREQTPSEERGRARDRLAKQVGDSSEQVRRYIRLNELNGELLDMVDSNRLSIRSGALLSVLTPEQQDILVEAIDCEEATPSPTQAAKLKRIAESGEFSLENVLGIIQTPKPNQREKLVLHCDDLSPYLPGLSSPEEMKNYIMKLLKQDFDRRRNNRAR